LADIEKQPENFAFLDKSWELLEEPERLEPGTLVSTLYSDHLVLVLETLEQVYRVTKVHTHLSKATPADLLLTREHLPVAAEPPLVVTGWCDIVCSGLPLVHPLGTIGERPLAYIRRLSEQYNLAMLDGVEFSSPVTERWQPFQTGDAPFARVREFAAELHAEFFRDFSREPTMDEILQGLGVSPEEARVRVEDLAVEQLPAYRSSVPPLEELPIEMMQKIRRELSAEMDPGARGARSLLSWWLGDEAGVRREFKPR